MIVHEKQEMPVEVVQEVPAQFYVPQPSSLPIEEQETQKCRAIVPVSTQVQLKEPQPPLIVMRNLKKTYQWGRPPALDNVSLQIERGEFVVVTGPAGSGKSTLLQVLACMMRPTGGAYWLGENMVSLFPPDKLALLRNQCIGCVFQEPGLLPQVSVLKNVALPLLYAGFSEAEQRRRAQKVLQAVGLGARLHATPEQLSSAQQQRVAIARALVNSPSLFLADEVTRNIDENSEREILALLQAFQQRRLTIVLVTQNEKLARYAQRHIMLCNGSIMSDKRVSHTRKALDELTTVREREVVRDVQVQEEMNKDV